MRPLRVSCCPEAMGTGILKSVLTLPKPDVNSADWVLSHALRSSRASQSFVHLALPSMKKPRRPVLIRQGLLAVEKRRLSRSGQPAG
jgi:hypothetical protein